MPPDTLEFEEPIAVLLKEIEALSMLPSTPDRQRSIDSLHARVESIRADIYKNLTPWQRVLVARHPNRPTVLDYVSRLFTDHPASVGETYGEHLLQASHFGTRMILAGLACLVHGLLPFLFVRTGSTTIAALHTRMVTHRRRVAADTATQRQTV